MGHRWGLVPGDRTFSFVIHRQMVRRTFLGGLLWLMLLARPVGAQPAAEFEAANKLFEQGKFADAAAAYERMLTNGPASSAVHFNLGNARFKSGHPGQAILHYHRALRLSPRDPDVRANLQFARKSLGVADETGLGEQALRALTLDEWAWLLGAGLGAWFLLLAAGELLPGKRASLAMPTKTLGTVAVVLIALLAAAQWDRRANQLAVVIVAETPVRPGPMAESKATYSLRDGAEVQVLESKDDWWLVRDAAQRSGWVKQDALVRVP